MLAGQVTTDETRSTTGTLIVPAGAIVRLSGARSPATGLTTVALVATIVPVRLVAVQSPSFVNWSVMSTVSPGFGGRFTGGPAGLQFAPMYAQGRSATLGTQGG